MERYQAWVNQLTDPGFLKEFYRAIEEEGLFYEALISKEYKDFIWDQDMLSRHATAIRNTIPSLDSHVSWKKTIQEPDHESLLLEHYTASPDPQLALDYVKVYLNGSEAGESRLTLVNYYPIDILVKGSSPDIRIMTNPLREAKKLNSYTGKLVINYNQELSVPANTNYLWVAFEGSESSFPVPVIRYAPPQNEIPRQELLRKYSGSWPSGVKTDGTDLIFSGQITLTTPLYIPSGYRMIVNPGTTIDLKNGAFLISESAVLAQGDQNQPILITSSDTTSMGFHVLNASESVLGYTHFTALNTLSYKGWNLTGAVNFYETEVNIDHCTFADNQCEDALNIIRSHFVVTHSTFRNTFADAFDSDFCTGTVSGVEFVDIGNDAIDFSGSLVDISGCRILRAGDKGVSCGEQSTLNVYDTQVVQANIGYASKDLSHLYLERCTSENTMYGLVAFQKKPEYGPGFIQAKRFEASQVDTLHLIETASRLNLNSSLINGQESKVALRFY